MEAVSHIAQNFHWRDYLQLCKPKVVALIVFTAVVGMLLAVPGVEELRGARELDIDVSYFPWLAAWSTLFFATLGIALASASAAAFNHVADRHIDAAMARTEARPLPTGHMDIRHALSFATLLGVAAMIILIVWVNALTALLTFLSLIGYAVVYTLYLKRATPQNIVIGGAAGAAPPVLGWSAVTGTLDPHSLLLFLIVFVWTPPHFWALAIHRREEYAKVNIPMLPVTHGVALTQLHILFYTILLLVVGVLPFVTHMSGALYLLGSLMLGGGFLYHAIVLKWSAKPGQPMKTFGYSLYYLTGIFTLLLVDHFLPLWWPSLY